MSKRNKKQKEIIKTLPLLIGKKVSLNDGRYVGIIDGFTGSYLTMKEIVYTKWPGASPENRSEFIIHSKWISEIKFINS